MQTSGFTKRCVDLNSASINNIILLLHRKVSCDNMFNLFGIWKNENKKTKTKNKTKKKTNK